MTMSASKNFLHISFYTYSLLAFLTAGQLKTAEDETAYNRSMRPENWTIISSGSFAVSPNGSLIINTPGNYLLSDTVQPNATTHSVYINASDVILDLGGHTIIGTGGTNAKGIEIAAGMQNVAIKNGQIRASIQEAIHINASCSNIFLDTIIVTGLTNSPGIRIDSSDVTLNHVALYGSGAVTNGIHIASGVRHITIDDFIISGLDGFGVFIDTNANNIFFKNGLIGSIANNSGITCQNGAYNITLNNISVTNTDVHGIRIMPTCHDIQIQDSTVRNCTNTGVYIDTNCYNIFLGNIYLSTMQQAVQCNNSCYNINCTDVVANSMANGITFTGTSNGLIRTIKLNRCKVANVQNASAFALTCMYCSNISITNTEFYNALNTATGSFVGGANITNSNNLSCINTLSNNHVGDQAYGFKLTSVQDAHFENCSSRNNSGQSATANTGSFGFHLTSCSGCIFKNCTSTSHTSKLLSAGWYLNLSTGTSFNNCTALNNQPINLTGIATGLFVGFYSKQGQGNHWYQCSASNNNAGNVASTDGYGACGFYLANETQSLIRQCTAYGQGNSIGHAANAMGIYLDGLIGAACTYSEIDECTTSNNCTSATAGVTAYGIRDTGAKTTSLIINCFSSSNTDNATPRVTTNYAANLPIGGSIKQNFPQVEAGMDGMLDLANKPPFYNVSMTA